MFSFSNMFHFFPHKFSRLGAGGFAFALIFTRPFNWFFFWHTKIVSLLGGHADVTKTVTGWQVARVVVAVIQLGRDQVFLVSRRFLMRSWAALMSVY
jgi:hypothetical protein